VRIALVGCGVIAARYAESIAGEERLELAGATDVAPGRAAELVTAHGDYGSLDELLADPAVDLVVNLTPPQAHAAVTRAAIEAGKHVTPRSPSRSPTPRRRSSRRSPPRAASDSAARPRRCSARRSRRRGSSFARARSARFG